MKPSSFHVLDLAFRFDCFDGTLRVFEIGTVFSIPYIGSAQDKKMRAADVRGETRQVRQSNDETSECLDESDAMASVR